MDPSDVVDYAIYIGEENCALGTVQCLKGCTYANIYYEIVDDEIVEYPFDFIGPIGIPLNTRQEKNQKPTRTNVGIKRKVGMLIVETMQSHVMEGMPISENIEGNVEEPIHKQPRVDHVSELVEQVVLVGPNVLAYWEQKVNSLMEEFVKEKLTCKIYSENRKPNINIQCENCGIDYGTGEVSLAARTVHNLKKII